MQFSAPLNLSRLLVVGCKANFCSFCPQRYTHCCQWLKKLCENFCFQYRFFIRSDGQRLTALIQTQALPVSRSRVLCVPFPGCPKAAQQRRCRELCSLLSLCFLGCSPGVGEMLEVLAACALLCACPGWHPVCPSPATLGAQGLSVTPRRVPAPGFQQHLKPFSISISSNYKMPLRHRVSLWNPRK